jgi:hypothetical protein
MKMQQIIGYLRSHGQQTIASEKGTEVNYLKYNESLYT